MSKVYKVSSRLLRPRCSDAPPCQLRCPARSPSSGAMPGMASGGAVDCGVRVKVTGWPISEGSRVVQGHRHAEVVRLSSASSS
jgi:hypothetical protein